MNEDQFEVELAHRRGERAYFANRDKSFNHYKPGTPGHSAWNKGYEFARSMDNGNKSL